jgi:hypothetical protein
MGKRWARRKSCGTRLGVGIGVPEVIALHNVRIAEETQDYTDIFRQASWSVFRLLLGDLTCVQDLTNK